MKLILSCLAALLFPLTLTAQSPQATQDEEVVKDTYAMVSFLASISPVEQAAFSEITRQPNPITQAALDAKIANAVPTFELSDFQTGTIASIANKPYGDFVSPPSRSTSTLVGAFSHSSFDDGGNGSSWSSIVNVRWTAQNEVYSSDLAIFTKTVAEVIALTNDPKVKVSLDTNAPLSFSRYVAYTVNATFQGKSTGPYNAFFWFGTDSKGNSATKPVDLISGHLVSAALGPDSVYPAGLF